MKSPKPFICVMLAVAFFCFSTALAEGLEAVFLDVGMADCTLIICDGEAMMIDAGASKSNWAHIQEILPELGVESLQYLMLTHPDFDHIGNAVRVLENYDVAHILMPPVEHDTKTYASMTAAIEEKGINKLYPRVGDTFSLGSAEVVIYGPHPVAYQNVNDWSIVCMIRYAGRSILTTGDIQAEAEGDLLAYNDQYPLAADVLRVAHHGSNSSSMFDFIEAVSPAYAVVSCNSTVNREYPHVETAMTLYDCGVEDVLTTEVHGDIIASVEPSGSLHVGPLSAYISEDAP